MTDLTGDYFEYVTVAGDRWDMLAWRFYGNQYRQTVLLEANRHLYAGTLAVPPLYPSRAVTEIARRVLRCGA